MFFQVFQEKKKIKKEKWQQQKLNSRMIYLLEVRPLGQELSDACPGP